MLIYDQLEEETVKNKIVPEFGASVKELISFKQDDTDCSLIEDESFVVTYLNDQRIAEIIATASLKKWTLAFLPHPGMIEVRTGYGISGSLYEAIEDIRNAEKTIKADLLLCNGRPVFNKVVVGNSLSLMAGSVSKNFFLSRLEKIKSFFKSFQSHIPREFTITAENKPPLHTAALGIVVVSHGKSSIFSRRILKGSFINDGRLHSLILAPNSLVDILSYYMSSIFERGNGRLPSFIGHIKSSQITISSPAPMDFSHDNQLLSAKEIELLVSSEKLMIVPGRYLSVDKEAGEAKDKFRVDTLPKGDAYIRDLTTQPLSWVSHASTEEFKELFLILRENARATSSYLMLMVLSTLLASFGLYADSSPVIIGAMILAPLMSPIISLSMGVVRQDKKLIFRSGKTIAFSLVVGYLAAILVTLLTPFQHLNAEISARIRPNLLDLGVAIVSGIAGAYAHAREEVAKTLAGVAIAVALVPPLAVSGIGLGWGDLEVFVGALLLFLTNLAGIVLAGIITFLFLGFSPFHLARKGLMIALLIVGLVSLPLGYGSLAMVRSYNVIRSLNNHQVDDILIKNVSVIRNSNPLTLSVTLLSDNPVTPQDLEKVKKSIADQVEQEVVLEVLISQKL